MKNYKLLIITLGCLFIANIVQAQTEPLIRIVSGNMPMYLSGISLTAAEDNTVITVDYCVPWIPVEQIIINKESSSLKIDSTVGEIKIYANPSDIVEISVGAYYDLNLVDLSNASSLNRISVSSSIRGSVISLILPTETKNLNTLKAELKSSSIDLSKYLNLSDLNVNILSEGGGLILPGEGNSLTTLSCKIAKCKSLDFSNCLLLMEINIDRFEYLEELILPGDGNVLERLMCAGLKLKTLDLSHCHFLKSVNCPNGDISNIILSEKAPLAFIDWSKNNINYINYPEGPFRSYYNDQKANYFLENTSYTINDIIDLSHWYVAKKGLIGALPVSSGVYNEIAAYPVFTWYNSFGSKLTEGTDYIKIDDCKYKFTYLGNVYCKITHPYYHDLAKNTNTITITEYVSGINSDDTMNCSVYSDGGSIIIKSDNISNYTIVNLSGIVVAQGTAIGEKRLEIEESGTYMVQLNIENERKTFKVLVPN